MSDSPALKVYEITVSLVSALVWPMVLSVILVAFRKPLLEILKEIPEKLSAATKLGVGSLSLEIQHQARAFGSRELARRLGKLSPEAIKRLIEMGHSHIIVVGANEAGDQFFVPDKQALDVIRELSRSGLIDFREDIEEFLIWIRSGPFEAARNLFGSREFRATRKLTDSERKRLREQYYTLNKLGSEAWNAVLQAILQQLRVSGASEPPRDQAQVPYDQAEAQERVEREQPAPNQGPQPDGTAKAAPRG